MYKINSDSTLIYKRYLLTVLLLIYSPSGFAQDTPAFSNCSQHFYAQTTPSYPQDKTIAQTYPLCFHGFAVLYSAQARMPIWSAEHLTAERIQQADKLPREDNFHIESRVPSHARADLADYKGSGYDRGHLAPNADMANRYQQYDSFSLANIVPQSPYFNRHTWKQIEANTRHLTKIHGEVYTLTGVVFAPHQSIKLVNDIPIPTNLFKVVYIPSVQQVGVYFAPNDESGRVEQISLRELQKRTAINAMPALSMTVTNMVNLPNITTTNTVNGMESATAKKEKRSSHLWLISWLKSITAWLREQVQQK